MLTSNDILCCKLSYSVVLAVPCPPSPFGSYRSCDEEEAAGFRSWVLSTSSAICSGNPLAYVPGSSNGGASMSPKSLVLETAVSMPVPFGLCNGPSSDSAPALAVATGGLRWLESGFTDHNDSNVLNSNRAISNCILVFLVESHPRICQSCVHSWGLKSLPGHLSNMPRLTSSNSCAQFLQELIFSDDDSPKPTPHSLTGRPGKREF